MRKRRESIVILPFQFGDVRREREGGRECVCVCVCERERERNRKTRVFVRLSGKVRQSVNFTLFSRHSATQIRES